MNKTDKALKLRLADAMHNERHLNVAETRYWCDQYKQIAIEALKDEALEALILKAGMSPVMQGSCYVMHPEALQAVIDVAIKQARSAPLPVQPTPEGKQCQAKFNIEDRVWYMKNNKPTEVIISAIEIFFVNTNQDQITYNAKHVDNSFSWLDHTKLQEAWLFKSKTELLESL
jgi:hypothetical protein